MLVKISGFSSSGSRLTNFQFSFSASRIDACCGQTAGVATPTVTLFGAEAEVNSGRTSK
jgi:hypothetical protein